MTARWLAAGLILGVLSSGDACAGGWDDDRFYGSPAFIGSGAPNECRPGPRRRYQFGRRCVWSRRSSVAYVTGGAPARMRVFRRGKRPIIGGYAAYTRQVPGRIRRSAGPLRFDNGGADPFVDALIEDPSARTVPTLEEYGIPAISGVPPIVIINPKRRPLPPPFFDEPLP